MLKLNRFAKHLLSFFAVFLIRLDGADANPTTLYDPKDGASYGCNTLIGGCMPGAYCTITYSNGSTRDIPLGYRLRQGTLTKLKSTYDTALGEDKYDVYYRGQIEWSANQSYGLDAKHLCEIKQGMVGRPVLEHVTKYDQNGVASRDDYYCVCQFPDGSSHPEYTPGTPNLEESDAKKSLSNGIYICAAGYWGPGGGTGVACEKCPTTTAGRILSENFSVYPDLTAKTVDARYTVCGDDGYYVTGTCVACPNNSDECPTYIDEDTQSFTCASGYIKKAKYCVACPHNAVSCAQGYIECTAAGSGTSGYYSVVSADGIASCVPCPPSATSCNGRRFYCTGGYYYNQPEYGTGNCDICPTGYHYCDNDGLVCETGFYKGVSGLGHTCYMCPMGENNTTGISISGATSINQCYITGTLVYDDLANIPSIGTSIGVMFCDTNAYYE